MVILADRSAVFSMMTSYLNIFNVSLCSSPQSRETASLKGYEICTMCTYIDVKNRSNLTQISEIKG